VGRSSPVPVLQSCGLGDRRDARAAAWSDRCYEPLLSGLPTTLRLRLLVFLVRPMPSNRASCGGAHSPVTGHLARDAADDRAFDAALRLSGDGSEDSH